MVKVSFSGYGSNSEKKLGYSTSMHDHIHTVTSTQLQLTVTQSVAHTTTHTHNHKFFKNLLPLDPCTRLGITEQSPPPLVRNPGNHAAHKA